MTDNLHHVIKLTAPDEHTGITAGQLRAFVDALAANTIPDDAHIKVRVGFKGQIKSIEVLPA